MNTSIHNFLIDQSIGTDNKIFADAAKIRKSVFVQEQGLSIENEFDEPDDTANHVVLYIDDAPIACGRLNFFNGQAKLCRLAVLSEHRNNGYGSLVFKTLLDAVKKNNIDFAYIHAQTRATGFYNKFGFVAEGNTFLEVGIPHIRMSKRL